VPGNFLTEDVKGNNAWGGLKRLSAGRKLQQQGEEAMRAASFLPGFSKRTQDNTHGVPARKAVLGVCLAVVLSGMMLPTVAQAYVFYEKEETRTPAEIRRDEILDMYEGYKKLFFRNVKELTVAEALQMLRGKKTVVVDVRENKEREVSMLPLSMGKQDFERQKAKYKDYEVIVYSTIGKRGGIYAKHLEKEGFQAYNLVGGLLMWVQEGQLIVDTTGPTKRVHVYDKKWDILPEDFEPLY